MRGHSHVIHGKDDLCLKFLDGKIKHIFDVHTSWLLKGNLFSIGRITYESLITLFNSNACLIVTKSKSLTLVVKGLKNKDLQAYMFSF